MTSFTPICFEFIPLPRCRNCCANDRSFDIGLVAACQNNKGAICVCPTRPPTVFILFVLVGHSLTHYPLLNCLIDQCHSFEPPYLRWQLKFSSLDLLAPCPPEGLVGYCIVYQPQFTFEISSINYWNQINVGRPTDAFMRPKCSE